MGTQSRQREPIKAGETQEGILRDPQRMSHEIKSKPGKGQSQPFNLWEQQVQRPAGQTGFAVSEEQEEDHH